VDILYLFSVYTLENLGAYSNNNMIIVVVDTLTMDWVEKESCTVKDDFWYLKKITKNGWLHQIITQCKYYCH